MPNSIGTRRESSLHRDLKFSYAGQGGQTEAEIGSFVADGVNAKGEFIEIQTGSFAPLKKKVKKLTARGKLCIVYPVMLTKYIDVFSAKGKRRYRRKSPKKGNPWDLFDALVYAPELPLVRGVTVELVLADVVEERIQDGKGSWRRKGVSIRDRKITAVHERIRLKKPADYLRFLPFKKNESFTSADLSKKAGIRIDLARKTLYTLVKMGLIEKTGKQKNTIVYHIFHSKI